MNVQGRKTALLAIVILVISVALPCCKTYRYVPVQTVLRDSIVFTRIDVDTVIYKDSIYIDRSKDTVYKYVSSIRYEYVYRTDTCYIARNDTIRVPYEVVDETSHRVKWAFIGIAGTLFMFVLLGIVILSKRMQ